MGPPPEARHSTLEAENSRPESTAQSPPEGTEPNPQSQNTAKSIEVSEEFLKRKRHELQTLNFELEQQHELFHRIYTNQRLWHSRLSLFVILLSSTMTLMSSLTFVLPADIIENKHDRIPNIVLSFLVTIISSILKWGGWDTRSEETKTAATRITSWTGKIKQQLIIVDEALAECYSGEKMDHSPEDKYCIPSKVSISAMKIEELQKVQNEAREEVTKSRQVIFNLKPNMVLDYEKRILEGALAAQNTEITRTFSSMFKTRLDEYYKNGGSEGWSITTEKSDSYDTPDSDSKSFGHESKVLYSKEKGDLSYLHNFSKLVNDQRNILATHEHMLRYAKDYRRSMFAERGIKRGNIYAARKLLWWLCCCAKCVEPELLPIDPVPLALENREQIKSNKKKKIMYEKWLRDKETHHGHNAEEHSKSPPPQKVTNALSLMRTEQVKLAEMMQKMKREREQLEKDRTERADSFSTNTKINTDEDIRLPVITEIPQQRNLETEKEAELEVKLEVRETDEEGKTVNL